MLTYSYEHTDSRFFIYKSEIWLTAYEIHIYDN